jgi:predicted enzyme related to lactoylglutathione lyase
VVDDPGSLNFNGLNTRDIEGAKAFYGSVFGGRTFAMDGGLEMWALDGYGDFIERHHPDLRKRWAEAGAPPGFEDVVATINRIGDDQRDTPPHWSVTFAVDDADTAAATATQLGGTVLVPPFDAPWVRMTILADPQGATFTASRFTPENADAWTSSKAQARSATRWLPLTERKRVAECSYWRLAKGPPAERKSPIRAAWNQAQHRSDRSSIASAATRASAGPLGTPRFSLWDVGPACGGP